MERFMRMSSRIAHSTVTIMCAFVGSTPAVLTFGRPWVFLVVLAAAGVVLSAQRKLSTSDTLPLTTGGVLTALGASLFPPAIGGFLALAMTGTVFLGARAIGWIAGLFGSNWQPTTDTLSFGLFVVLLLFFGLGFFAMAARGAVWPVYFRSPGSGLGLGELATSRTYPVAGVWVLSTSAFTVAAVATVLPVPVRWGLAQVGLVLFAAPLWQAVRILAQQEQSWNASRALVELLGDAGFGIESLPGSSQSELAPLISGIDLLAQRNDRRLAIEIKTGGERAYARAASGLAAAAMALSRERGQVPPYEPVLVLIDAAEKPAESSVRASGARIVAIESSALSSARAMPPGSPQRQEAAQRVAKQLTEAATETHADSAD